MIKGSEIRKYIEENVPINVYPAFTTDVKNTSVVYTISTPQGGHVTSDNVELRVIGKDYDEVEDIKQQLIDLFSTEKNWKSRRLRPSCFYRHFIRRRFYLSR
ncbi:hypothetical protein [Tetragenococcus muriaticus]|uniref:hypothetical protein n=1 Tax=Tetragenococcus muriaticus TaxID=64642 RepID=UPI0005700462|nr:hypothetical protein [Tetragenococcus muriaticus]